MKNKEITTIMIPIKSRFVKDILAKTKTFELRRTIPKKDVDRIILYETMPVGAAVASIAIKCIHHKTIEELWELTKGKNSLTKEEFNKYFDGKTKGYAYEISKVFNFFDRISLKRYNIKNPPQNFIYMKDR